MDTKLLLVDDEPLLVKGLKYFLEQEGFTVVTAQDGEQGLDWVKKGGLDLVVLDVMLPKMDGFTVCREIRKVSDIPIIMLTAKGSDMDKIIGLEIGADDYLAKPFNSRELLARIKALLRRARSPYERNRDVIIEEAGLRIDSAGRRVFVNDKEVELTAKEFELLSLLANHPGRVYSRDNLLEFVWGYDFAGDARTVDVHIRRLREKIEQDPGTPRWILTKWGTGYYFRELI